MFSERLEISSEEKRETRCEFVLDTVPYNTIIKGERDKFFRLSNIIKLCLLSILTALNRS